MENELRAEIKVPKEKFHKFYSKFKHVKDMLETQEWKECYSQFYEFDKLELDIEVGAEDEWTPEQQVQEFIKCAKSFTYFCHKYVKIFHPMDGLIPCILYKYQRKVIKEYEANRFCIISKFRQGGLTTTTVLWGLWRAMFKTDQQILVLSKTDREAIAAGEVAKRALEYLPEWLKPQTDGLSKHEKTFKETGSSLKFYTPEAARGKSVTTLIIDEAAFVKDMETHWKAIYPTIATGGSCCVISTVNGLGNWYEETYHSAEAKKNNFHVIDLDYWEHPDYIDPKWVKETKANLGEKAWQQEVLRSFLGSGDTYIPAHIISDLLEEVRHLTPQRILLNQWANENERYQHLEKGAMWIWKEPRDGHEYIIGTDCAAGVKADNSAFQVIDNHTLEQVAEFYSNSISPNALSQLLQQIGIFYNNALIIVENNGIGQVVVGNLYGGLAYENLYFENKKQGGEYVPGVKTGTNNRTLFLEALQNRLLNGSLMVNSLRFVDELKTFVFNKKSGKAEALKGKHDDLIMAMGMALKIRDTMMTNMPIGSSVLEGTTQVFKSEIYEQIRQEIMKDAENDSFNFNEEAKMLLPSIEMDDSPGLAINTKNKWLLNEFAW